MPPIFLMLYSADTGYNRILVLLFSKLDSYSCSDEQVYSGVFDCLSSDGIQPGILSCSPCRNKGIRNL